MSSLAQKIIRLFSIVALVTILSVSQMPSVSACPNCKEGFSSQEPGKGNLAKGFYYSILFMLGTPITIVTVYGYAFYRSVKKAQLQQQQQGENSLSADPSQADQATNEAQS